jgi:hypothetical protein
VFSNEEMVHSGAQRRAATGRTDDVQRLSKRIDHYNGGREKTRKIQKGEWKAGRWQQFIDRLGGGGGGGGEEEEEQKNKHSPSHGY